MLLQQQERRVRNTKRVLEVVVRVVDVVIRADGAEEVKQLFRWHLPIVKRNTRWVAPLIHRLERCSLRGAVARQP